jgi:LysR family transcriptional regulator, glycine cleavage system transcriptional activator
MRFDAVARHGTFTRAALELNVSQPAISRRIAALEADLGTPVFGRDTRPLRLTADGRRLFEVLRASFSRLEQVVQEIRGARPGQKIVLGVDPGFASYWLLPRLPRLQAAFADYSLRILTGDFTDDRDDVDLLIEFGTGARLERRPHIGRECVRGLQPRPISLGRKRTFGSMNCASSGSCGSRTRTSAGTRGSRGSRRCTSPSTRRR